MTTMASSRSQTSSSAASSSEELSEVQVLDSSEPLVTASSSVPSGVQVLDSSEPLVTASSSVPSGVQVLDSNEPLGPTSEVCVECVQVIDSCEPLVHTGEGRDSGELSSSAVAGGLPGPSGIAGPSSSSAVAGGLPGPSGIAGPSSVAISSPSSSSDEEVERVPTSGGTFAQRRAHYYSDELRTMWNWRKIFERLGTVQQCVQFSEERGLVKTTKLCRYHRRPMSIKSDGQLGIFRCTKSNCRSMLESRATGTWFENVRLGLPLVFQLMYAFCINLTYDDARKETAREDPPALSARTIGDWYSYCRETIAIYILENNDVQDNKIGGPGKIVQIDESKFGRRKYNRGRHVEGHWVIGMIEDNTDDLRLELCPDNVRSAEILVPLIQKHVREGSIIHTDYWRAYLSLPEHGYIHRRVNHSDPENRFVAPDGTHTQRIESQWRPMKQVFRQQHHHKGNFSNWLAEYRWRRNIRINLLDPYEELIKAIKYVYNIDNASQ